jgi:hypothetical protein
MHNLNQKHVNSSPGRFRSATPQCITIAFPASRVTPTQFPRYSTPVPREFVYVRGQILFHQQSIFPGTFMQNSQNII